MLGCTILDRASGLQRAPYTHLSGDAKKVAEASFVAPLDGQAPKTLDPRESIIRNLKAQLAAARGGVGTPADVKARDEVLAHRQNYGVEDSGVVDGIDYSQERTPDGLKTHDKHGRRRTPKAIANTRKMLAAKAAKQAQRDSALSGAAFPQDDDHTAPVDPGVDYSATQEVRASDIPLNSDAALVAWITENQ